MSACQQKLAGEKQSPPLQILVYTPQSDGAKGVPQTSEVFGVGGGSKGGAGGGRILEFTNGNGETLRIPEYSTHIARPSPSSCSGKAKGLYCQPATATPVASIYHHHHHRPCPDRFLHLYPSHQEPTLLLPLPQQPLEFDMPSMTIPPISEEERNMVISLESPQEEMLGLDLGSQAVMEELFETCLPVDSTDEGKQWWYELLCAEGDEEGFWTRFLGGDGGGGDEAGWDRNGEGEAMGGVRGLGVGREVESIPKIRLTSFPFSPPSSHS
ncbi:hypothetical protein HOY82DRAFT_43525 [Tuber indicum]|nr:hypothetical protein HOY82DRAFT_43525 [Tuber indicum]